MSHDRFSKVEAQALHLHDEFWLDTILYFRNYHNIIHRYDDWKDIDCFYLIPLKLSLSYCIGGHVINMAEGPVYLGTFVRNTLEHPRLYTFMCPDCGKTIYPYGYNGSPLSGRVDLEGTCECGWDGYETVSGWRIRSETLKRTQQQDRWRANLRLRKKNTATIQELLDWLQRL